MIGYHTAEPCERIVVVGFNTGAGGFKVCGSTFVWPLLQEYFKICIAPSNFHADLQIKTREGLKLLLAVDFIIKFKEDNESQRKLVSSLRSDREIRSQQDPIEPMKQAEFREMVEGILLGETRKYISKISRDEIVNDTDLPRRLRDKIIRTPASNDPGPYPGDERVLDPLGLTLLRIEITEWRDLSEKAISD